MFHREELIKNDFLKLLVGEFLAKFAQEFDHEELIKSVIFLTETFAIVSV